MKDKKASSNKKESRKAKKPKEKKEETKLEEELKEAEREIKDKPSTEQEFFEEPVRQLPITEAKAPVLERIIQNQEQIISTEDFNERNDRIEREERRIDYSPVSNAPDYSFQRSAREENKDKKYESSFVPPVLSRREIFKDETRQEFLRPAANPWREHEQQEETNEIELLSQELKLPFEEQKKYKRHKLR